MTNKNKVTLTVLVCIFCFFTGNAIDPIVGALLKGAVNAVSTAKKNHDKKKKNKKKEQQTYDKKTNSISMIETSEDSVASPSILDINTEKQTQINSDHLEAKNEKREVAKSYSPNDFVTLTVSSDGPTKDDATKNALRSAIEQAFGAFVSANTTILNDEIVKDEIVTLSNGSIQDYKELSNFMKEDGRHYVTLTATVCLPQLVTYAKSHGSECEFAGSNFGMQMKILELEKENELKALYNLTDQIILYSRNIMDHTLTIGDPRQPTAEDIPIFDDNTLDFEIREFYPSANSTKGYKAIFWEVNKLPNYPYWQRYAKLNTKARDHINQFKDKNDLIAKYYVVPMTIKWEYNPQNGNSIYDLLMKALKSIALWGDELENYKSKGFPVGEIEVDNNHHFLFFRNTSDDIYEWLSDLFTKLLSESNNFSIKDNTGTSSTFYPEDIDYRIYNLYNSDSSNNHYDREKYHYFGAPNTSIDKTPLMLSNLGGMMFGIFGTGIFNNLFCVTHFNRAKNLHPSMHVNSLYKEKYARFPFNISYVTIAEPHGGGYVSTDYKWEIKVFIPREDISKYSKFWIEPNNN